MLGWAVKGEGKGKGAREEGANAEKERNGWNKSKGKTRYWFRIECGSHGCYDRDGKRSKWNEARIGREVMERVRTEGSTSTERG